MSYKVVEIVAVARDFKTKAEAEEWASYNLSEDEDRTWDVRKE